MTKMFAVISSNIEEVGYEKDTQELFVRFKNGSLYKYYNVPELEFVAFYSAESVGRYFNVNISRRYQYERIY